MIHLETERLILRNYRLEDFNDIYEYFSNEDVARYEDFYPMSNAEVKELIEEWKDNDSRLVVELKDKRKKLLNHLFHTIDAKSIITYMF